MPTFQELSLRLSTAKSKRAVFLQLIEYVDATFRDTATGAAGKKLLTDDKLFVDQSIFEAIVCQHLSVEVQQLEAEIAQIQQSTLAPTPTVTATAAPSISLADQVQVDATVSVAVQPMTIEEQPVTPMMTPPVVRRRSRATEP